MVVSAIFFCRRCSFRFPFMLTPPRKIVSPRSCSSKLFKGISFIFLKCSGTNSFGPFPPIPHLSLHFFGTTLSHEHTRTEANTVFPVPGSKLPAFNPRPHPLASRSSDPPRGLLLHGWLGAQGTAPRRRSGPLCLRHGMAATHCPPCRLAPPARKHLPSRIANQQGMG